MGRSVLVSVVSGPDLGTLSIPCGPWTIDSRVDDVAADAFASWLIDPRVAGMLGRGRTSYSRADVARIRALHDGRTGWMGFVRDGYGRPVGYVAARVDPENGVARVDMVAGDPEVNRVALQDAVLLAFGTFLFEVQSIRKAAFAIRADNRPSAAWLGRWAVAEGRVRGHVVMPDGRAYDQLLFGIMADEWPAVRDRLAAADPGPPFRVRSRRLSARLAA